jgi:hypothetical protein
MNHNRKTLDILIRNPIPEEALIATVASVFAIDPLQIVGLRSDGLQQEAILYFLNYHGSGFRVSFNMYINEYLVPIKKNDLELVKDLARALDQDILTAAPTELPGFEQANEYLLLARPSGDAYLVIEMDSTDGVEIDETPSFMTRVENRNT